MAAGKKLPHGHYGAILSQWYSGTFIKKPEDSPVDSYYTFIQVLHQTKTPFTQQS
jgi:hypothetical protein